MQPSPLTRRITIAGPVALIVFVVLGAAAGAEPGAPSSPDVPTFFGVEAPRVGDEARYDYIRLQRGPDGDLTEIQRRHYLTFRWLEPQTMYDIDGVRHQVNRLLATPVWLKAFTDSWHGSLPSTAGGVRTELNQITSYDAATGQQIATTTGMDSTLRSSASLPLGVATFTSELQLGVDTTQFQIDGAASTAMLCGFQNALQGTTLNVSAGLHLFPPCLMLSEETGPQAMALRAPFHGSGQSTLWRSLAKHQIGPHDALIFEARGYRESLYAWMSPKVAYPLQIMAIPDQGTHLHAYTLTTLSRGSSPLPRTAAPPEPAADLAWTSRGPSTIDDSGRDVPFPLTDALRRANEPGSRFAGLLARPGGYLYHANHYEERDSESVRHSWDLRATAGKDAVSVLIVRHERPYAGIGALRTAPHEVYYRFNNQTATGPTGLPRITPIPLGRVPALVPTLTSLEERWQDYAGTTEAANTWGFSFGCWGDPCRDQFSIHIGRTGFSPEPDEVQRVQGSTRERTLYALHLTFTTPTAALTPMVFQNHQSRIWSMQASGSGLIVDQPTAYSQTSTTFSWHPPDLSTLIGITGFAVLAGLLAWLWPALRASGLAALFTRLETSKLLDHARRQEIVQHIEQTPGIHFMDLARETGIGHGSLDHHLRLLVKGKILTEIHQGGYRCFVRRGSHDHSLGRALAVVKSSGAKDVMRAVKESPGVRSREIARRTGLRTPTVSYHVKRLVAVGLLRRETLEGVARLFRTELADRLPADV